jgi:hypothetical protein
MWSLSNRQQHDCPKDFQDRLTRIGGINRYGEPNFKLVWSQSQTLRAGAYWPEEGFHGYRDIPRYNSPCWLLMQWKAPEEYGSPDLWYFQNEDENGLQTLGEFPFKGQYEIVYALIDREIVNGNLKLTHLPLCSFLIDRIVPIIMQAKDVSITRRKEAMLAEKHRKDQEEFKRIEDARLGARLQFTGPTSFAGQRNRTSLIEKKILQMERHLAQVVREARKIPMGFSQRS